MFETAVDEPVPNGLNLHSEVPKARQAGANRIGVTQCSTRFTSRNTAMVSDVQRGIRRSDRFDFAVDVQLLVLGSDIEHGNLE